MTTNCPDCENLRRLLEALTAKNTRLREENTERLRRLTADLLDIQRIG